MATLTVLDPARPPSGDLVVFTGPYTVADRDAVPSNGYRHELLDGMLVMQAAPRARHQQVAAAAFSLLRIRAPSDLQVLYAPFDVRVGDATAIQPDIVVARRADIHDDGHARRPVLCVEIATPSTRDLDLGGKKDTLAKTGCPVYWTIEPDDGADAGPELTGWELPGRAYVETARVSGRAPYETQKPFDLTLIPADLLNG